MRETGFENLADHVVDRVALRSPPEADKTVAQWKSEHCTMTQREIARAIGVSRARVYQIEKDALKKIRAAILADPVMCELIGIT